VFLGEEGKEIIHRQYTRSSPPPPLSGAENMFSADFSLDTKVDRCTVRVRYFDTIEKADVPLDLEVGLGL
jgi:hypothetical protein